MSPTARAPRRTADDADAGAMGRDGASSSASCSGDLAEVRVIARAWP